MLCLVVLRALASCTDAGIGDLNALPFNYSTLPECCFVPPANLTACCAATSIHPAACSYAAQCQTPNDTFPLLFTPEEKMLVHDMTNFWASFAANDAPQPSGGRKAWPMYMYRDDDATATKSNTMQLDIELQVSDAEVATTYIQQANPDFKTCTIASCILCALGLTRIQGRRL
jgi:hypothetical protein